MKLKTLRFANDVLPCERKRYFALWHAHQGLSSYQIAAMGIMTASRVRHAITTYRQGGLDALKERVHPGRQSRLTPVAAQDLQDLLARDDRTWNTRTLAEYLQDTHDITLGRSAVNAQLHRLNLTWQRTRQVVAGQADPEEKGAFKDDLDVVKKGAIAGLLNLVFLDEAAIWLTQPNTYSWRRVRHPMAVPTSKARGITARLNLMGCVNAVTGHVQYREIHGNTTGEDTKAFLETLAGQADPARPTVVIADRASVHTCKLVSQERERWKERGLIVVYLPPYSPELNPMEIAWRHLKYHDLTQRAFEDKDALRAAVSDVHWGQAI